MSDTKTCKKSTELLAIKGRAINISRIRTAVKLMQSSWTLVSNHNAEYAVRPNGHWSCMSDLPSKGAPSGCTTICDIVT